MLCFPCYKLFNRLLKSETCSLSNDAIIAKLVAKESYLEEAVERLAAIVDDTVHGGEAQVQLAFYDTALHICGIILSDQAFLFPDIYKVFLQFLPDDIDSTISTSKSRLLTFIANEFGDLLTSFCQNNRIGTVFHRAKADISALLSNALWKQSTCNSASGKNLNESVHELANHIISQAPSQGHSLALDVDGFINTVCTVAPELWEHIQFLTRSVNEHKGRKAAVSTTSFSAHIKRLRQAFLLSVLLYITNDECSFPYHTVLADATDS